MTARSLNITPKRLITTGVPAALDADLRAVMRAASADIIARMLEVLYPDAETVLDATFGNGKFWTPDTPLMVTGLDLDPTRARDVCANFRALPFLDDSFDVVIFDPPYHTNMGRAKPSVMGARFGTFDTIPDLKLAVEQGCAEAWRVARLGMIVKSQDYIHESRLVRMSRWIEDAIGVEPYDFVRGVSPSAITDPKWGERLSVRHGGTPDYWAFRTDGPIHKRRDHPRRQGAA